MFDSVHISLYLFISALQPLVKQQQQQQLQQHLRKLQNELQQELKPEEQQLLQQILQQETNQKHLQQEPQHKQQSQHHKQLQQKAELNERRKKTSEHNTSSISELSKINITDLKKKTTLRAPNNSMDVEEVSTDSESDDETSEERHVHRQRSIPAPAGKRDTTLIFTTSISKGINVPRFNRSYEDGWASFTRFHGAKAEYMPTYIVPRMTKEKPSIVLIQAGGNDLPTKQKDRTSLVTVANSVIEAGLKCRKLGALHVLIGGVTIRRTNFLKKRCDELNNILKSLCLINNFTFINNSDIKDEHLYTDGVHLNDDGYKLLADNYLNALCEVHHST